MADLVMERSAVISDCGGYRYRLARQWSDTLPIAAFIMLNPSTADASVDDPTIRKCMGFAHRWGMGGIVVGNLFAFRATKPEDMKRAGAPTGPDNWRHLEAICRQASEPRDLACGGIVRTQKPGRIICAWGVNGSHQGRDREFLARCRDWGVRPRALRLTKSGAPEHPLYVPYGIETVCLLSALGADASTEGGVE